MPPEVLQHVFFLYKDASSEHDWEWIRISQICGHWRDVALSSATLWNTPNLRFPELALEMLRRARRAPLHVMYLARPWISGNDTFDTESHEGEDLGDGERILGRKAQRNPLTLLSLDAAAHIIELDIAADGPTIISTLQSHPGQLTRLRDFSVENTTEIDLYPSFAFMADQYPSLERLNLYQCYPPWTSNLLLTPARLRRLDIHTEIRRQPHADSFDDVLTFLKLQPNLESIYLAAALPLLNDTNQDKVPIKVHLPHLKQLDLEDTLAEVQYFFSCLRIFADCRVKAEVHQEKSDYRKSHLLGTETL
ncbi:hypothetical protein PUNSTDRAFT_146264 [Punctularia strigosozonata HHB-11173 SS5]|uniref:Uncharacterized protein n=1 Tax=Punctularia strigosozonata (strain HHB-11173) TaxID=741275 RepID=R7S578_PUNST|nr:uncharacterized protein PUNSTDRAFT_146264 [Punctularia strigosozonata HHB-11173 SS5]EIN05037.1 hypothetical protein PUNSTDRAFT_146264 [Punctularia strigosozonata HHB-11173 SS5]